MTVQPVNFVNFKQDSTPVQTQTQSQTMQEQKEEGISDTTKIAIGVGIAAVAALAIYALTRKPVAAQKAAEGAKDALGKGGSSTAGAAGNAVTDAASSVAGTAKGASGNITKNGNPVEIQEAKLKTEAKAWERAECRKGGLPPVPEEISNFSAFDEMSLAEFKSKGGILKDGEATLNGKPYWGNIITPTGSKIEYYGTIQQSVLPDGTIKKYSGCWGSNTDLFNKRVDVYDPVTKETITWEISTDVYSGEKKITKNGEIIAEPKRKSGDLLSDLSDDTTTEGIWDQDINDPFNSQGSYYDYSVDVPPVDNYDDLIAATMMNDII